MKKYLQLTSVLIFMLLLSACSKKDEHYTVTFKKDAPGTVRIVINNVDFTFDGESFTKEVDVKYPSSLDAHVSFSSSFKEQITVALLDNEGKFIGDVTDAGYVSVLATEYKIYYRSTDNKSSGGGSGSGGGGGSSGSHLCGYITQAGTPCKNRVSDGYTYCWRHR